MAGVILALPALAKVRDEVHQRVLGKRGREFRHVDVRGRAQERHDQDPPPDVLDAVEDCHLPCCCELLGVQGHREYLRGKLVRSAR